MNKILLILLLAFGLNANAQIIVTEFNAEWNAANGVEWLGKLSDCAQSIKAMLATQEQKLTKAEQTDDDIFITLESRRKEWDNDLKELHSRITTNSRELREHQIQSESKMLNEIRAVRTQLSERVGVLEKWRWVIIGGSIIIGFMMSNPDNPLFKMF